MPEAGRLVITVVENPTINQIAFEGNDSLDDEELFEVVQLRPRLAYSVPAAEADAQRIIAAYQAAGRYAASVTPVIIRLPENRVDLVYEIKEGRVTSVQRINFTGNQAFSDRRLRRVVETNQSGWLSFIFGRATYDADRLEVDKELLRRFYLERGYIDVRILSGTAELARERTGFFLSFTISEGAALQLRPGVGQLGDPRARRDGLPAAAGAGGRPRRLQRRRGRHGDRAHGLPGRPGRLRLRRDRAAGDAEPGDAHRRHQLRAARGRAGVRRAHRHHRQHPHARPGDPPAVPPRRGRRLQRARGPRGGGPDQRPRLLRDGDRQRAAGNHARPGADRGRGRGAADRQPQPRRRLLVERGPERPDQHDRAQLPRARPDRQRDDLGEHAVRQLRARLLRARAVRPRPAGRASTSTTATATSTSSRSTRRATAPSRGSPSRSARTAG